MKLTAILSQVRQYQCSLLSVFFFEPPVMYSYSALVIPWHFIWYHKLHISHSIADCHSLLICYNDHKGFQHCPQSDFCLWYYILDLTSWLLVILNVAKVVDFTCFLIYFPFCFSLTVTSLSSFLICLVARQSSICFPHSSYI